MERRKLATRSIRLGFDLDGVIFDFDKKLYEEFALRSINFKDVHDMHIQMKDNESLRKMSAEIYHSTGFYSNLPIIEGAVNAFKELDQMCDSDGDKIFEMYIVSTPSVNNETCVMDKVNDVKKWFGMEVADRMILCGDKSLINLDIMIDDKLNIVGINGSSEFRRYGTRELKNVLNKTSKKDSKNTMSFEHIRFRSPMYIYEDDYPFHMIDNWTNGEYKDTIETVCLNLDLLD